MRDDVSVGRLTIIALVTLSGVLLPAVPSAGEQPWEVIKVDGSVVVSRRGEAESPIPTYRAVGEAPGSLQQVLSVVMDISRFVEWIPDCHEARVLVSRPPKGLTYYYRTVVPWPADDRDTVVKAQVTLQPGGGRARVSLTGLPRPDLSTPEGVVRVTRLEAHYDLVAVASDRTRVEYQVSTDPGGVVPKALVSAFADGAPLGLLKGLLDQVRRTRTDYGDSSKRWGVGGSSP